MCAAKVRFSSSPSPLTPPTAPGEFLVSGSTTLGGFPDDRTADTTITETPADSGIYEASIDLTTAGATYFVRIELPD